MAFSPGLSILINLVFTIAECKLNCYTAIPHIRNGDLLQSSIPTPTVDANICRCSNFFTWWSAICVHAEALQKARELHKLLPIRGDSRICHNLLTVCRLWVRTVSDTTASFQSELRQASEHTCLGGVRGLDWAWKSGLLTRGSKHPWCWERVPDAKQFESFFSLLTVPEFISPNPTT